MNRYLVHTIRLLLLLPILVSCDAFLDFEPKNRIPEEEAFVTNENFKTYAWCLYEVFPANNMDVLDEEFKADLGASSNDTYDSNWRRGLVTIPVNDLAWNNGYNHIRRVNVMIGHIKGSQLTRTEQLHWESVGRFFRAYTYFQLLKRYGGVPIVRKVLTDNDTDILYGRRNSRDETAQFIMDDLAFAKQNIRKEGSGANTINRDVVNALISSFGLFEGTWRKYHAIADFERYLDSAISASQELIRLHPKLHPRYDDEFNSNDLSGLPGILLYKAYKFELLSHNRTSAMRNSSGDWDITKKGIDLYLCLDGKNRWNSPLYAGDKTPYEEFRNRDRRLYFTCSVPYRVVIENTYRSWRKHPDIRHSEYFDLMATLSDDQRKSLPEQSWNGDYCIAQPHFRDYSEGSSFNCTRSGYRFYKYYNRFIFGIQSRDETDCPIFRMAEVMLNYAEACCERGEFDQSVCEQTINPLRARGEVAPLILTEIDHDPTRDVDVDPILWEIRRERAVELMGEGYRFDDLRRWKKLQEYAQHSKEGCWVDNSEYAFALKIENKAQQGYIRIFAEKGVEIPDYYYLYPIPSMQIVLNPNLEQNPGWK